jgi:tRNA pseudouridine32 synthase/23S rRNA pseudouridine746 synthase
MRERADAFMQMEEVTGGAPNAGTLIRIDRRATGARRFELRPHRSAHQLRVQMGALGLPVLGDRISVLRSRKAESEFNEPFTIAGGRSPNGISGGARRFVSGLAPGLVPQCWAGLQVPRFTTRLRRWPWHGAKR